MMFHTNDYISLGILYPPYNYIKKFKDLENRNLKPPRHMPLDPIDSIDISKKVQRFRGKYFCNITIGLCLLYRLLK
jgi:hypothetical protein